MKVEQITTFKMTLVHKQFSYKFESHLLLHNGNNILLVPVDHSF